MSKLNNCAAATARRMRHIWRSMEEFGYGYTCTDVGERVFFINMAAEVAHKCGVSFRRAKAAVLKHL